MKTLRIILVLFLCFILVVLSVGFLLPGKVRIERSLLISAKSEGLFEQVNTSEHWKNWSPWLYSDTSVKLSYSGAEKGAGALLSWQSKDNNNGKILIISDTPYDSILVILDFGDNGKTSCTFRFQEKENGTYVVWQLESDLGLNPVSRWIGLFTERMVGPDMELGLMNLEKLSNANKKLNGFEVVDYELPARILVTVRDTARSDMIEKKLPLMYEKISRFIKNNALSPSGAPLTIYHSFSHDTYDFETCIPIVSIIPTPDGINCMEVPPQRVVMVKYFGTRKSISNAYSTLQLYMTNNGLYANGSTWEEYVTNPKMETDTMAWQTNIYFPIK